MNRLRANIEQNPRVFLTGLLLIAFFSVLMLPNLASIACADHTDFCFRTRVTVSKSTSGALTDYPIAVSLNAKNLIDSDRLGPEGWDFFPIDPSAHEIHGFLQELGTNAAKTAFIQGDIAGDSVNDVYFMFTGSAEHKRDQGVLFHQSSGADVLTVADDATLDITDNLDIRAIIQADDPDQAGDIIDKFSANTGYSMTVTTTGSGEVACTVGDGGASNTISTAFTGTNQAVACTFVAAAGDDQFLYLLDDISDALGTADASADTDYASIGTNATALTIGDGYDGVISEVQVRDSSGKVSQWSFNPDEITETQTGASGNSWTWQGNIDDVKGSNDASYSLVHDQSNITVTLGAIVPSFGDEATLAELTSPSLIRNLGDSDFSTLPAVEVHNNWGSIGSAFDLALDDPGVSLTAFRFFIVVLVMAAGGFFLYKNMDSEIRNHVFMIFAIALLGVSGAIGWITIWWAIIPSLTIFSLWLLVGRTSSA